MSQKLPVNCFKWVEELSKFDERFIKDYDENSNKRYVVEYPKMLFNLHSDLSFLPKRNKIKECKLVCKTHDKENYVVQIRAIKQALNHGLLF